VYNSESGDGLVSCYRGSGPVTLVAKRKHMTGAQRAEDSVSHHEPKRDLGHYI
jgi:hypothetical protein